MNLIYEQQLNVFCFTKIAPQKLKPTFSTQHCEKILNLSQKIIKHKNAFWQDKTFSHIAVDSTDDMTLIITKIPKTNTSKDFVSAGNYLLLLHILNIETSKTAYKKI